MNYQSFRSDIAALLRDKVSPRFIRVLEKIDEQFKIIYKSISDLTNAFNGIAAEGCRVYRDSNQSIPNNTLTAITFNKERYDPFQMHSINTNTGRIVLPKNGRYIVGACIEFDGHATGNRQVSIRLNGATVICKVTHEPCAGNIDDVLNLNCVYEFRPSDYIEVMVFQNSGGALNVQSTANYSPEAWAEILEEVKIGKNG